MSPDRHTDRISHIDAMRTFAVLLVVVSHAGVPYVPGGSGVTVFFTISGFVITTLVLRENKAEPGFDVKNFYFRRARKLAPPLLVVVVAPSIVYATFHPVTPLALIAQVAFVFNWGALYLPAPIHILPGTSVVWSLAIEEQFYLVFALIWLAALRGTRPAHLLLVGAISVAGASAAIRVALIVGDADSHRIYLGTDTRVEAIAIGVASAVILDREFQASSKEWVKRATKFFQSDPALVAALCLYGLSLVWRNAEFRDSARYSLQAVSAAIVIAYGLRARKSRTRRAFDYASNLQIVQVIGLASYSIYLVHAPLIYVADPFFAGLGGPLRSAILTGISVAAGVLLWAYLEEPVRRHPRLRSLDALLGRGRAGSPAGSSRSQEPG